MIKILNVRRDGWVNESEYVGGRLCKGNNGSVLRSKFKVYIHTTKAHALAVAKYRIWLWEKIETKDKRVCSELNRLKQKAIAGNLDLICWCAPLPCHADVVKRCIEWMVEKDITL